MFHQKKKRKKKNENLPHGVKANTKFCAVFFFSFFLLSVCCCFFAWIPLSPFLLLNMKLVWCVYVLFYWIAHYLSRSHSHFYRYFSFPLTFFIISSVNLPQFHYNRRKKKKQQIQPKKKPIQMHVSNKQLQLFN